MSAWGGPSKEEVDAIRLAGNELYRRGEYRAAMRKYSEALGGETSHQPEGALNNFEFLPLINNRAACYLEIADAMPAAGMMPMLDERRGLYERAESDADEASKLARTLSDVKSLAKALFRLGRARLRLLELKAVWADTCEENMPPSESGEELIILRKEIAQGMELCLMNLRAAAELQPADRMIAKYVQMATDIQEELALAGAPPPTQGMPEPDPDSFAPGVRFEAGDSWIENVVHLEIPIRKWEGGPVVKLPVYLTKQKNDNNMGELAIWMMYSEELLGVETLRERVAAIGHEDPDYFDAAYGALSTPAQDASHIQSPDEFVMAFTFFRGGGADVLSGVPAALEDAGVISRKRVGGHTRFGEALNIYGVNF
jgi:tetratricopeptide (TPR) repeat protein